MALASMFGNMCRIFRQVRDMVATSEFLKFDDEDHGNIDYEGGAYPYGIHKAQKDHMLFLCYYEPDQTGESLHLRL